MLQVEQAQGEPQNHNLIVRVSLTQKQRLEALAEASGFKSLSDYVRTQLLNPSIDEKLNNILLLLKNKNEGENRNGNKKR